MIYTVTLNPAVDKTALSPGFAAGRVNRLTELRLDAGGKGINVSKIIKRLGGESVAYGFVGGSAGEFIRRSLDEMGISSALIPIEGETRTNLKIVDPEAGCYTDINEPGPAPGEHALAELEARLFSRIRPGDSIVLAGGLPAGIPDGIYADWTRRLKAMGVRVAADLDGERLRGVIAEAPDLIKPNDAELCELLSLPDKDTAALAGAALLLCRGGVGTVVVSLGERGALFVREGGALLAVGPSVRAVSTVGAGDTVTACMVYAQERGMPPEEAARLAVGAATAKVLREGSSPPDFDEISRCSAMVRIAEYPLG